MIFILATILGFSLLVGATVYAFYPRQRRMDKPFLLEPSKRRTPKDFEMLLAIRRHEQKIGECTVTILEPAPNWHRGQDKGC